MDWLAKSPLATALRAFVAVVLAMVIAQWTQTGTIAFDKWQTWVIAGLASAVPVLVRWLNPSDKSFGRGSKKPLGWDDSLDVLGEE